jgi:acetyl esterase/lipase
VVQQHNLVYDPAARHEVTRNDVVYRDDGDTQWPMTIFQPVGDGPFPALARVHGGAWNLGARETLEHVDMRLAECGMVIGAMDFRLAPDHPYPAQIQDVNLAIRWLKLHAAEYKIDTARFGGAGDSSGAHTIMLNAMRPNDPEYAALPLEGGDGLDASVDYVLAMWGVLDPYTRYYFARATGWDVKIEQHEGYFLTPEAMRRANPQMIVERGESVRKPPVLIIQGDEDDNIPRYIPLMFEEAYRAAGGSVRLEWFPGMPHGFAKEPGEETDRAIEIIRAWLAEQIGAAE